MSAATGPIAGFTAFLANLVKQENRAALAALRRGLGKAPGASAEVLPYVMPFISDGMSLRRQDDYFLVASLFAAHQLPWAPTDDKPRVESNLGASYRLLDQRVKMKRGQPLDGRSSIEKRFVALLNAEREDLPDHLRHAIALLKAEEIPVNWALLLQDLEYWGAERRGVQRSWAQAFWRVPLGQAQRGQAGEQATSR